MAKRAQLVNETAADAEIQAVASAASKESKAQAIASTAINVNGTQIDIAPGATPIPIGRRYLSSFPLDSTKRNFNAVSGDHAVIARNEQGVLFIKDQSRYGSFVDGERIAANKWVPLRAGAEINLGSNHEDAPGFTVPEMPRAASEPFKLFEASNLDAEQARYSNSDLRVEITRSDGNSGHDKYMGYITPEAGGKRLKVYLHNSEVNKLQKEKSLSRLRKEQAAYQLSRIIGFENPFPVTAPREEMRLPDGRLTKGWIQEDAGEKLEIGIRELAGRRYGSGSNNNVSRLVKENPKLHASVEEAFIERIIYGDQDDHSGNFTIAMDGSMVVRNIDLDYAFEKDSTPTWTADNYKGINARLHADFSEQPFSPQLRDKLSEFLKRFDNIDGKAELVQTGISAEEIDAVMARTRWLVAEGKFPRALTIAEVLKKLNSQNGATVK
jgi:hypothetical protein